jgi:outer membrane lipase/esterase
MQMAGGMKVWCRGLRVLPWLLLAWLTSCGGGTTQIEPFVAQRVIFIGDETVGLLPDGRRYGINVLNAIGLFDCAQFPIWTQQIASSFGFTTDFCGGGAFGVTRATPGAKAADIEGQISAQIAASGVGPKDLFIVMVGMNDVIELYEQFPGPKTCSDNNTVDTPLESELARRGSLVGAQVNRVINADGRLIVSTVHDIGHKPYARAKEAITPGQMNLLTCMTAVFNARVRVEPIQDGRFWGLVLADDDTIAVTRNPGSFGVNNITDVACTVAPPDCTTATLVSPEATNYLWATDRVFGPVFHNQLAAQAIARARNNPF